MPKQAVLLLAHGTPETIEDIPEYLRNVVSGRPLPEHVIEEIKHRYSLIGRSPLTEITLKQGRLVEAELAMEGVDAQVYVGMRNWKPYIPDVVRQDAGGWSRKRRQSCALRRRIRGPAWGYTSAPCRPRQGR